MFIMPEHRNLVTWLHDQGFTDVFTFDFRMSNRHIYNLGPHRWSMDDCALYDHPKAIRTVREIAGNKRIHVICHCLGSMSFRSEEHTSELQSLMRISYAVFCLKQKKTRKRTDKLY